MGVRTYQPVTGESTMAIIEFSLLRNYPLSNPNRGEDGHPKAAYFGGVLRAHLSSQSQNRAFRERLRSTPLLADLCGYRTREISKVIADRLSRQKFGDHVTQIANRVSLLFRKKASVKRDGQTNQVVSISRQEVDKLADLLNKFVQRPGRVEQLLHWANPAAIFEEMFAQALVRLKVDEPTSKAVLKIAYNVAIQRNVDDFPALGSLNLASPDEAVVEAFAEQLLAAYDRDKTIAKKYKKASEEKQDATPEFNNLINDLYSCGTNAALDIALFGRAGGDLMGKMLSPVSAALGTAFAIGVNPYEEFRDYFTSMDDFGTGQSAAYPGERFLHSSLFYSFHWLDLSQLKANLPVLAENAKLYKAALGEIIVSLCEEVPSAMSTKMGQRCLPVGVLGLVRERGQYQTFANAYERSLENGAGSLAGRAVHRLARYYGLIRAELGDHKVRWCSYEHKFRYGPKGQKEEIKPLTTIRSFADEIVALALAAK